MEVAEREVARGVKLYLLTGPPEATGLWLGIWSWLLRRFGSEIQGERFFNVAKAVVAWQARRDIAVAGVPIFRWAA